MMQRLQEITEAAMMPAGGRSAVLGKI